MFGKDDFLLLEAVNECFEVVFVVCVMCFFSEVQLCTWGACCLFMVFVCVQGLYLDTNVSFAHYLDRLRCCFSSMKLS